MRLFSNNSARTAAIYRNVAMSFLLKAFSALITLLMVPLTITCLGEYQNGVWLTVSSLLVWIDQMDIGLGNGLRNKLAESIAPSRTWDIPRSSGASSADAPSPRRLR